jgi:hypothetical protein
MLILNIYVLLVKISYLGDNTDLVSECELGKVRGKPQKVPLFVERKVCLLIFVTYLLHIWNQHFISYKMVPILISFEKVVEVLYFANFISSLNFFQLSLIKL